MCCIYYEQLELLKQSVFINKTSDLIENKFFVKNCWNLTILIKCCVFININYIIDVKCIFNSI